LIYNELSIDVVSTRLVKAIPVDVRYYNKTFISKYPSGPISTVIFGFVPARQKLNRVIDEYTRFENGEGKTRLRLIVMPN